MFKLILKTESPPEMFHTTSTKLRLSERGAVTDVLCFDALCGAEDFALFNVLPSAGVNILQEKSVVGPAGHA